MHYELATMTLPFGSSAQAVSSVLTYATAPEAKGELLGRWFTDIGPLNQMVALDGTLRFTNIWAYPTLDARSRIRAEAVADGNWPPKGGPAFLTTQMTSTIALPTAVSPLK